MSLHLSLGFLLTIMMTFYKKSVHSLLAFAHSSKDSTNNGTTTLDSSGHRNIPSLLSGLNFVTFSGEFHRSTNVVESSTVKAPPSSAAGKRDPGGIGFLDDVGGTVDGLMSCTESLGFESSDERRVDLDPIDDVNSDGLGNLSKIKSRSKKTVVRREERKFPPPLSSLNHNGKPSFFLRSVRRDGRLELTEVKIGRPEVLRASREDGRLRLHLIRDDEEDDDVDVQEEAESEIEEEEVIEEKVEPEEGRGGVGEWRFPATNGGGDGFRRCHEVVSRHHHHHNLHTWSQHCVTIR